MAYGQTSAGKTHTMFGSGSGALRGIVPRVAGLASSIAARPGDCTFKISASVVEIYNEKCRDLLNPAQDNMQVFQDAQAGVHVPGLTSVEVHSEEDCLNIVQKGMSARAVAATDMNEASSRSHCLVILTVDKSWKDGRKQRSKLCLVVSFLKLSNYSLSYYYAAFSEQI
jgi:kinesin family protein 5